MKIDSKSKNRLVIYFFYDKDGIIDEYIPVMLEGLKDLYTDLLFISNGEIASEGKLIIEKYTDTIIERENKGFDVWAYKEALEYYGWSKLGLYDEIVLMNYTIFGPLYSFKEMFETMSQRDIDFWGITKHHKVDFDCFQTCKYKYIPEHIQSNFLVIRKSLVKSKEYQDFWNEMKMINSYGESVGLYEAIFTKDFSEKGFKADVYINTDDLEGYTRYPLMMMSYELIKNRKCPVMKIKSFSQNYYDILGEGLGNCTVDTFRYIKNNLEYNEDLIWQHILRTENMADIKHLMHINYILPQEYVIEKKESEKKIALMMHLYYEDLIDQCLEYAKAMPSRADLYITVMNKKMKNVLNERVKHLNFNNIKIIEIENKGRDVSSLLVGCAPYVYQYDYVCFVHDKKTTQIKPYCNGEAFAYKCFVNNLASKEYVQNVIYTFENNPRLGLLTPPPPNHGDFYQIVGSEWASNYENTLSLAYKLNLRSHIYHTKEPIAPLGTMFWFRPEALKSLFDYGWTYEDFPQEPNGYDGTLLHAIERIYAYVVQHEGYYPAWVMTDQFARIELTNLHFMLREVNLKLFSKYYTTNLLDMTQKIEKNCKFVWSREIGLKGLVKKYCPLPIWNIMKKIYYLIKK